MMKLLVLGATGSTGQELLKQALERGHSIRALVRSPDKITLKHDNLEVKTGNALSADSVRENLEGCDVILSALGHPGIGPFMRVSLYEDQARALLGALEGTEGTKVIITSSWCIESKAGNPMLYEWLLKPFMVRTKLANMVTMEKLLSEATHINYTFVRPGILTQDPKTDKEILATPGGQFQAESGYYISRADVARFMLDCLDTDQYSRTAVAIGVRK